MTSRFNSVLKDSLKIGTLTGAVAASLALSLSSLAQTNRYTDNRYDPEPYISIYEDCDYRGQRRDIAVGEFRRMRDLDFGNDKLSSIRVPEELEVIIYEHDGFKGDYARVDRDVSCFDRTWDNQVSSIKVLASAQRDRGSERPIYGGRDEDEGEYQERRRPWRDYVNAKNVASVSFNERVLKQSGKRVWQIADRRRGVSQYREVGRDDYSVYLNNEYNSERIRIDFYAEEILIHNPRGEKRRFSIDTADISFKTIDVPPPVVKSDSNTRINSNCFDYHAYTKGKTGGIRFYGKESFQAFQKKGHRGRICHNGELHMEINKRAFDTDVTVKIQDKVFRFASGEKEDRLKNNWYRKDVKLQVGR
ncbi:MAG: beta/gamma crystallin family protein [Acidiferrobacterales bacterium]|nr:beta/gamma crystallin family protein [Acidiferrobacterales bacterium]